MGRLYFLVGFIFIGIAACAGSRPVVAPAHISPADEPIVQSLYHTFNQWRGVPYREGGLSQQGVDCSGFVYLAYKQAFNRRIPRTTERLAVTGSDVNSRHLRPGDLVFFRTGWKKRHVGIYLRQGKFMHASSSRGVMISRLDNPYWSDAYWMARRL